MGYNSKGHQYYPLTLVLSDIDMIQWNKRPQARDCHDLCLREEMCVVFFGGLFGVKPTLIAYCFCNPVLVGERDTQLLFRQHKYLWLHSTYSQRLVCQEQSHG